MHLYANNNKKIEQIILWLKDTNIIYSNIRKTLLFNFF